MEKSWDDIRYDANKKDTSGEIIFPGCAVFFDEENELLRTDYSDDLQQVRI
ncbi:MAG: hypothetical protein SOI56_00620 [Eubacteriales bacterium]|jgi:hypothetical protein